MEKILKFLQLHPKYQLIFIQAFAIQLAVRFALDLLPFYMILNILQRIKSVVLSDSKDNQNRTDKYSHGNPPLLEVLFWAVRATSSYIPGSYCLCQAISGHVLMAIKGLHSDMKIGVRIEQSSMMNAHAWLCYQGQIVVGNLPDIDKYKCLPNFRGIDI